MTPEQYTALQEAVEKYQHDETYGLYQKELYICIPFWVSLCDVGITLSGRTSVKTALEIALLLLLVEDLARAEKELSLAMHKEPKRHAHAIAEFSKALTALLDFHRQVTGG